MSGNLDVEVVVRQDLRSVAGVGGVARRSVGRMWDKRLAESREGSKVGGRQELST